MKRTLLTAALSAALLLSAGTATAADTAGRGNTPKAPDAQPLVIGHRGASGYRPEHTLAAYELAIRMGADYLEPDLVSTKDHVLVLRHENEISGTTDVADHPEFADRKTTKAIDGQEMTGWFTEDFTLAELKTLRAKERLGPLREESQLYDGRFQVPTFAEALKLRADLEKELGRPVGIIPETKHPTYFDSIGLSLEEPLLKEVKAAGLNKKNSSLYVQSFEYGNLVDLRHKLGYRGKLVFLTSARGNPYNDSRSYEWYLSERGLRQISKVVNAIGPEKNQVIARTADGSLGAETGLVARAHRRGLQVTPYTLRSENQFLPTNLRVGTDPAHWGKALDEADAFLKAGVDGVFCDQPDVCVEARKTFR